MIVVAAADTVGQIESVIDRIGNLEGVERTTSSIILSTKLER
jgi:translation elongation factor EF-1beta